MVTRDVENYWLARFFVEDQARAKCRGESSTSHCIDGSGDGDAGHYYSGTFLDWVNLENGVGVVLFEDLGVEKIASIPYPMTPGQKIRIKAIDIQPRLDGNSIFVFEAKTY
mmetsp:Transcript_9677/g.24792  ORF Transcript_9677/g.24792 Transcript_9677/m.24792 type:complete len:111 (+) Transcript_9677:100-432(+)